MAHMKINIKDIFIAILATASIFYVVEFDALHKISGISILADALINYPTIEALVLGLLLGLWSIVVFILVQKYFAYLHCRRQLVLVTAEDIFQGAQKQIQSEKNKNSLYRISLLSFGAGASCFLGALAIVGLIQLRLGSTFPNPLLKSSVDLQFFFLNHVVISPVIETVLCIVFLELGRRWVSRRWLIVGVSALVWGGLHASLEPLNFFATTWIFFVISDLYIALRDDFSPAKAGIAILIAHFLNNLLAFFVVLIRM
jgi:hypothetical protein